MDIFTVQGGTVLTGDITLAGAKNVALKACVASLLTDEPVTLHNIPNIRDVRFMIDVVSSLGINATYLNGSVSLVRNNKSTHHVPLEVGAQLRTSVLVLGPLLARFGEAVIPNPGGCRIGARPIDRHIDALRKMGADITYHSDDGFFHAKADALHGADITFPKNTHTGTEAIILAAVLSRGETTIRNAAEEVEIDDLIKLLNSMGARIKRDGGRIIRIDGVSFLHSAEHTIMSDRNEEVTFAIAAAVTDGSITVHKTTRPYITAFIDAFTAVGGGVEQVSEVSIRYYRAKQLTSSVVATAPYPGFMTDWQAPWAFFMTQANGESVIHETVFESRFSYVSELAKMGARIEFFSPDVDNPKEFYNFNWEDKNPGGHQAIRIKGPTTLHNAVLDMSDIRAGATLLLASIKASGTSYIQGVEQIDRGYEHIETRLNKLGAKVTRDTKEDVV